MSGPYGRGYGFNRGRGRRNAARFVGNEIGWPFSELAIRVPLLEQTVAPNTAPIRDPGTPSPKQQGARDSTNHRGRHPARTWER